MVQTIINHIRKHCWVFTGRLIITDSSGDELIQPKVLKSHMYRHSQLSMKSHMSWHRQLSMKNHMKMEMKTTFFQKTKYSLRNCTTPLSPPLKFLMFNRKDVIFEQTLLFKLNRLAKLNLEQVLGES